MKKFLLSSSVAALLLPGLAFAAYNDVNLAPSSVVLSVGGVTLNVYGTNAVVQSIAVGASSFSVTLLPGSFIEVQSTSRNVIATDATAGYIDTDICSATESRLKLVSSISTGTVTITPSAGTCSGNATGNSTSAASTGSGSGSYSGGGGGGGGGVYVGPTVVTPTPTVNTSGTQTQTTQLTAQLNTLLAQLAALKGGSPNVNAVTNANANASFKRNIQVGAVGDDAKSLQVYLNGHGFPVAAKGAGSPGNETARFGNATKAALIKFQKSVGITPASGYLGSKTRAYIAAHQ